VMDMIFNHCGANHPWLTDMPTRDWFNQPDYKNNYLQTSYKLTPVMDPYASDIDLKETVEGWFVRSMPDLNHHNVHVMNYLIQNSIWWIETAGIDGIRMDTYPYAYADAMARWMKCLNTEYPNFNVVGETWVENPAYTAAWQKGNKMGKPESYLPTVMDFSFYEKVDSAKQEETDGWWRGYNRVYNSLCLDYLYPNPSSVMAFIENHDTDRFLGNGQDVAALKQALALLLTINRIPQLYYGTEILMNGTKEITDGNVRKDFPGGFPGDTQDAFTAQGRTPAQNDMFNWLSRLLRWRKGNDAIIKGKMTQFIPYNGIYVIARTFKSKHAVTIINGTTSERQMKLDRYAEIFGEATGAIDVPTGNTIHFTDGAITLPARGVLVLEF
jgi:Glycosidases